MPKKVKLIINISFSAVLLFLLIFKLCRTLPHWTELSELWGFGEKTTVPGLLFVFGAYLLLLITALSFWLRGAAAITLSAIAVCCSPVLYAFEIFCVYILGGFYIGCDPFVSVLTNLIAVSALVVAVADSVLRRKNKRNGTITQ